MGTRLRVSTQAGHQGQVQVELLNQPILEIRDPCQWLDLVGCFLCFCWVFVYVYIYTYIYIYIYNIYTYIIYIHIKYIYICYIYTSEKPGFLPWFTLPGHVKLLMLTIFWQETMVFALPNMVDFCKFPMNPFYWIDSGGTGNPILWMVPSTKFCSKETKMFHRWCTVFFGCCGVQAATL